MTPVIRSLVEEALGIGWFILATQTTGTIRNICLWQGIVSIVFTIYFALQ